MARIVGSLKKIPKLGPQGKPGKDGRDGKDGLSPSINDILRFIPSPRDGLDGKEGPKGKDGKDGLRGPQGPIGPKGDSVSLDEVTPLLEALVESEVNKLDIPEGPQIVQGGGRNPVKYITTITEATYSIKKGQLSAGMNIFGVNYAGDVTITLPVGHEQVKNSVIIINDESGAAGANNITVKTDI